MIKIISIKNQLFIDDLDFGWIIGFA